MIQRVDGRTYVKDGITKNAFKWLNNSPEGNTIANLPTLFVGKNAEGLSFGESIPEADRWNNFYTLAHYHGILNATSPQRTLSTFHYQTVLAYDIDGGVDVTRPLEYAAALTAVIGAPVTSATIVCSGNGLHFLYTLRVRITEASFFKEARDAYNETLKRIDAKLKEAGLPGYADPRVFDHGRIFRMPDTINKKAGQPDKQCYLIQADFTPCDIDLYEITGIKGLSDRNVTPEELRRTYPTPDFPEVMRECEFMKWAVTSPHEVHEPDFFNFTSILHAMQVDDTTELMGKKYTPREIAEYVKDNATGSPSLMKSSLDEKWDQSGKYGAPKCSTINEQWALECSACPHFQKCVTPLALKSDEHIGSESNGYWVLGANGAPKHPHYGDLSRVYKKDHEYVVTPDTRVHLFNGKHFEETEPLLIKKWIHETVTPTDPLRDSHCNEFLNQILRVGAMSKVDTTQFFEILTDAKLNCGNGVLDIITGRLSDHTPTIGFQYVLPFSYDQEAVPEYFLDWLGTITNGSTDLMESILDVMAYCLWPHYDDHIFTVLSGEGRNGKSTLIEIIRSLLGKGAASSVNLHQLSHNRFMPAMLEGKLANLCEETKSGDDDSYRMSTVDVDVLKNLSAGGVIQAERKGQQGFEFKNKAKLIFSANKPPRFTEAGEAIRRRMLVIPFNYTIENPDSSVTDRLTGEQMPGILALLVRRIQDNLKKNNGKFKVYRGGVEAQAAQDLMLAAGSTVAAWADETLEVTEDENVFIEVSEAYKHYTEWCGSGGYKYPRNKDGFSKDIKTHVRKGSKSKVIKRDGKIFRVYTHIQYQEGAKQ